MSNFFLLNEAIEVDDFDDFLLGMSELSAINKFKDDVFLKHHTLYEIPYYSQLCSTWGQVEQVIIIFIEQLNSFETYLPDEETFEAHFPVANNAFLGIDFSSCNISIVKQIIDDNSYQTYRISLLPNFERLLNNLGICVYSTKFEKDFKALDTLAQQSIIDEFQKAKKRGLKTSYYPDTKIIKDVTPNKPKCKVLELRLYSPIALRVYFNETHGRIKLGSIEQKSNPNQSEDINLAHNILATL